MPLCNDCRIKKEELDKSHAEEPTKVGKNPHNDSYVPKPLVPEPSSHKETLGRIQESLKKRPMKKEELDKSAPPGWSEETMHKLKNKYGVESAFKIAWAAHNKHKEDSKKAEAYAKSEYVEKNDPTWNPKSKAKPMGSPWDVVSSAPPPLPKSLKKGLKLPGQKEKMPNMEGFQSLVPQKPKSSPTSTGTVNTELKGFSSLAQNPNSGLFHGKLEKPKLPGKK